MPSRDRIYDELVAFIAVYPFARLGDRDGPHQEVLRVWVASFEHAMISDDAFRDACANWRATQERAPKPAQILGAVGSGPQGSTTSRPAGCSECRYVGTIAYAWHGISPEGFHAFRECVVPCTCPLGHYLMSGWCRGPREVYDDPQHRAWLERGFQAGHVVQWWRGGVPPAERSDALRRVSAENGTAPRPRAVAQPQGTDGAWLGSVLP